MNTDNVSCHGTLPKIADHQRVLFSYYIESQKQKPKTKTVYDYKNADINCLINYINSLTLNRLCLDTELLHRLNFTQKS